MRLLCSTWEAFAISARCPSKPKPVISVQPVAPCLARQAEAAALLCTMLAQAPVTQRPLAFPCMLAAMITPVPRVLVKTNACPSCKPLFRSSSPGFPCPVTLKPTQQADAIQWRERREGVKQDEVESEMQSGQQTVHQRNFAGKKWSMQEVQRNTEIGICWNSVLSESTGHLCLHSS